MYTAAVGATATNIVAKPLITDVIESKRRMAAFIFRIE